MTRLTIATIIAMAAAVAALGARSVGVLLALTVIYLVACDRLQAREARR